MSDLAVGRGLAAAILAGTLAGGFFLAATVTRSRERRTTVARRPPARWAEVVWPLGTLAIQAWAAGGVFFPAWFYAWPWAWPLGDGHLLQLTGFAVWSAGGVLVVWAGRTLGRFMTPEIRVEVGHRLVQRGPFRRMRHPVYTANVTMAVGLGLVFLHPVPLALAALLAITANHRARLEEDLLRSPDAFGSGDDAYMARTGRFLPRLGT